LLKKKCLLDNKTDLIIYVSKNALFMYSTQQLSLSSIYENLNPQISFSVHRSLPPTAIAFNSVAIVNRRYEITFSVHRFKIGLFKIGHAKPKVRCDLEVPLKSHNSSSSLGNGFQATECDWDYKWRFWHWICSSISKSLILLLIF